jgi:DNA-binding CsgD family transcriptional regulator
MKKLAQTEHPTRRAVREMYFERKPPLTPREIALLRHISTQRVYQIIASIRGENGQRSA